MQIDNPTWCLRSPCPVCGQGSSLVLIACPKCGHVAVSCAEEGTFFSNPSQVDIPPEDKPLWRNYYYGILGKNTGIAMILANFPDGSLIGTYRYVKNGVPIRLSGRLEREDKNIKLIEKAPNRKGNAPSEKISGKFTGHFDESFKNINGTWTNPDGTKSFPFVMKQGVLIDSKAHQSQPDNKGFLVHTEDSHSQRQRISVRQLA